jgi:holo-[acyl-carrier protein] synthase
MGIVAIGTDIVALERLKLVWERHPERFLARHFHPLEIEYCLNKADPLPSLGARFAAKEAFQKCWPESFGWRDVWVAMSGAKPTLKYSAAIEAVMAAQNWRAHVSLAHERSHATAVVILEHSAQSTI